MRTRNFIILLALVPLLLIVGAAVYFLGPWRDSNEKPVEEKTALKVLAEEQIVSPILSFDGEKVWYMTWSGRMFRLPISPPPGKEGGDKEGVSSPEEYLLPEPLANPAGIIWPRTGGDFIVQLPLSPSLDKEGVGGSSGKFILYDSSAKQFLRYSSQIQSVQFASDINRIIYAWRTDDGRYELKTADKTSQNFQKVADLRRSDYAIVVSPARDEVVVYGSDQLEPGYLMLVDLKTGEFRDVDQRTYYEGALFSPDGKKLLATKEGQLVLYDLDDFTQISTNIFAKTSQVSWAQSGESFFVGMTTGFVKYDTQSGQQEQVYRFGQTENLKPVNLLIHPQKNLLFFVDENSGKLYQLSF